MRSTRKSSSYARRPCCRQVHKMTNEMKSIRLIVAAMVMTALPASAEAQDNQGLQIRGLTLIDTTVRLDRGGAVDLSLISGKIRVTGWDRADVKISATIESGILRFDANPSRVSLSVEESDDSGRRRRHDVGDARYDVSVPRGARLILESRLNQMGGVVGSVRRQLGALVPNVPAPGHRLRGSVQGGAERGQGDAQGTDAGRRARGENPHSSRTILALAG